MHPGLKIKDHFCQYDHIKGVRNYLLKLVNTKIVSRSETVPDWLFEDIYPSKYLQMIMVMMTMVLILG